MLEKFDLLPTAQHNIRRWLSSQLSGLSKEQLFVVGLVLNEVVQNIMRYAFSDNFPKQPVAIQLDHAHSNSLTVTVRDYGRPCDPDQFINKQHTPSEHGGMGIHLIKKNTQTFTIAPQPDGNLTTLTFNLLGAPK
ncbi:MAG: ATP-binding protein [Burkholderiales bacterium]|jgi:anti-sigma regulatory factor (Ser/Thr protein kinase)|nr:ATP-binding protein [Burkholderiales bacterium]